MLPNLVILGAQKSASSYVQLCLAEHPDIFIPRPELPLFTDCYYEPDGVDALAHLLPGGPFPRVFGIKAPDYLGSPEVPARLAEHLPEARLLAILREPIARAISAYYHFVRYAYLPLLPLNEGLTRVFDAQPGPGFAPERALLEYGCYASALHRYLEHFARDRLHVILHDDVSSDPAACYREILEFLEVSPAELPSLRRRNEGVYSYARLRYLRAVQKVSNRVQPERNSWRYRFGLFGMGVYFLARQVDKRVLARFCAHSPDALDPDLATRLREYYRPEVAGLEEILGRDLSSWKSGGLG